MPNLANITVKKADGSTDITWTGVQPSSGDTVPAVWRSNSVGTALAHRPYMNVSVRNNANKTLRRVTVEGFFPETAEGADGITRVINTAPMRAEIGIPNGMSDVAVTEAVHQLMNLLASTLMKSMMVERSAAT